MSTALAIAATTAVLRSILDSGIVNANLSGILGEIKVTALPPDRVTTGTDEPSRLNLFMYRVTPNAAWRNVGLPGRDARGDRLSNPPLALDLHYMVSAYGGQDLFAEILLGYGVQLLHEMPVLTRDAIRAVFTPPSGGNLTPVMQRLASAELADQIELIKITPQTLSLDEMSKLWSPFQDKLRPSAVYLATTVLIEARASTKSALPLRTPQVTGMPSHTPVIGTVEPQMVQVTPGATLTLRGQDLLADGVTVLFGTGSEQAPDPAASTNETLVVPLPTMLSAGVNTVQVVQHLMIGEPASHRGIESNVAAFMVRPAIKKTGGATPNYDITVDTVQDTGNNTRSANVTVKLVPNVGQRQRVELLMNQLNAASPRAYTFPATARDQAGAPATSDTVVFAITGVLSGDYLLRIRVDGAESLLDVDATGHYSAPKVTLS